ncbi:adhesion G protein-coupled receptor E1-like isoform X3 [Hemiscyllium ocellatum]|uniref:adhesion G protein-coupled receptor E1-like isoform X3 n=1 Tax=Hemiscyllium ocellatum TaxID=170820 RepID=UPI0029667B79|nr:adhesion G protein-coupled receptor E1-like isoform X3 [Hemiscyllium ocellatum]
MTTRHSIQLILVIYFNNVVTQHGGEAINCGKGFYLGTNRTCVDDNECGENEAESSALCGTNTECHNTIGSFYCTCKKGYASESGETNFTTMIHCREQNECYQMPPVCGPNTICYNTLGSFYCLCKKGFITSSGLTNFTAGYGGCFDINECETDPCGSNATCTNKFGEFECTCNEGFITTNGERSFTDKTVTQCRDIDECETDPCGSNATCTNSVGDFECTCNEGFVSTTGERTFTDKTITQCQDIDECETDLCGSNATCTNMIGSFSCTCSEGFVSIPGGGPFGNKNVKQLCIADMCKDAVGTCGPNADCSMTMEQAICSCRTGFTSTTGESTFTDKAKTQCKDLMLLRPRSSSLQDIDVFTNQYFSSLSKIEDRHSEMFRKLVSNFLEQMEKHTLALANTLGHEEMKNLSTNGFDVNMQAIRNSTIPKGGRTKLSTSRNSMDISWNNVAGNEKFDVAAAALISYKELDSLMKDNQLDSGEKLELISEVVTAAVTNKVKENPYDPVILTFENKKHSNKKVKCVYWDSSVAAWSIQGCSLRDSNVTVTVCSCTHLSSFAVLMALHDIGEIHSFNLYVITTVGIILSLVCLFISILTFILCRSIKSVRTTIHTHLCVSLFLAEFLFLVGISRTENKTSCAIIAGLLHYLFLACFSWMLLEGIQLYLMVVKVFNANSMRLRYMCLFGYGFPLLVVTISAAVYSEGYGTDRYCWLSLKSGFLWAFIAPVCVIILVNAGFFILTVWRLVNKFSSLNPDMSELKKVRAFTFTAIAQLCLLGCTWIFGMLHFQENTIVMAYVFTVINSLQGAFIFILHCLFNKQVRDEYSKAFIRVCQMKKASKYSEFSTFSTQGLKSTNETGM